MTVAPGAPTTLHAGTAGGLFRSTDAAATWTSLGAELPTPLSALSVDLTRPSALYAAAGDGVFASTDAGITWTPRGRLPSGATAPMFAVDPHDPLTLYVGTQRSCVVRSTDGGASWQTTKRGGCLSLPISAMAMRGAALGAR